MLCFRYGFSNMRYIASLISGVGIFMMGAGLSWYHGIMGLLHPQPMESLLWVSVSVKPGCHEVLSKGIDDLFLSYRLTVFWQVPWCQKEVGLPNIPFWFFIYFFTDMYLFLFCSHITSSYQWDKEELPPERTVFLWIWSVHWKSFFGSPYCCCSGSGVHVMVLLGETAGVFLLGPHLYCQPV